MVRVLSVGDVSIKHINFSDTVTAAGHVAVGPTPGSATAVGIVAMHYVTLAAANALGGVTVADTRNLHVMKCTCALATCLTFRYNLASMPQVPVTLWVTDSTFSVDTLRLPT